MHDLVELRDANAGFGNKAAGLARLIAAGLPVPPGFAIAERVFERVAGPLELKDLDAAGHLLDAAARRIEEAEPPPELREHLRELGREVIVRSSSAIEDGAHGGGAGVFASVGPVANDVAEVWRAIRDVWTSVLAPAAIAYARGRRQAIGLGVIVQQHVAGERVTVYTQAPGHAGEIALQRGAALVRTPRAEVPADLADHHAVIQALRAERVIGMPADVELVQSRARDEVIETWVVQARPIVVAPPRLVMTAPPPIVIAPLQDGRVWTWDVTHNPDPLSPAQRGLVELVERERLGAYELRVAAGYLYSSLRVDAREHDADAAVVHGHVSRAHTYRQEHSAALVARCRELEAEAERILADRTTSTSAASGSGERQGDPLDDLEAALATYVRFYKLWANELSPRITELRVRGRDGRERAAWPHPSRDGSSSLPSPSHRPSSIEAAIAACARGAIDLAELVRRIGAVSPTWDIAVPPFGERAELLQQAVALVRGERSSGERTSGHEPLGASAPRPLDEGAANGPRPPDDQTSDEQTSGRSPAGMSSPSPAEVENNDLAAIAADLAERDDLLFARAQHRVREALLARGAEVAIGDDIFWIDLELARSADPDPIALQRKAAAARAAHARAAAWQMPLVVGGPEPAAEPRREMLHGVGSGPRVTGRVVRFASLASAVLAGPGDVIVVRAVTPALAVFVGRCAALVSETGGLLDHGAALARELGITCVVGCRDAWTSLHDDDTVDVDGDAGSVTRR